MLKRLGNRAGTLSGAVALVVGGFTLHARAVSLLLNGGFESPTDNSGNNTDTTATGWSFYGSDVRAEFAKRSGTWGIWHQTFGPGSVNFGGVYQNVTNITDGTSYTLTGWQYWEAAAPTVPGLESDLALTFLNSSGQPVGPVDANGYSDATYTPAVTAPVGTWTQYTVTGIAPAGATQVQVSFDFINGSTVTGAQGVFVDDADLEGAGIPYNTAQWANTGSGDWNQTGNWSTGSIPNAVDGEADFVTTPTGVTSPSTIYTNVPITVGTIKFDNANETEIAGVGNITLQVSSGNALITVNQGTDIMDLPLTIASNTTFQANGTSDLIIANPITIDAGKTLTQSGTGTVTYQSIITVLTNGAIQFANSTHAHELSLASNATASISSTNGTAILTVDQLANSGTLNVANNELIVNYGSGADPIATIKSEIISGFNNGTWNGAGINSSSAAAHPGYALGYADAADPGNPAGLASGTIEVLYTLQGDADLNHIVNGIDFGIVAANFNKGVNSWDQGDFDYNNIVNGIDFGDLAANFNKGASGAAAWDALVQFAAANGLMADVPEPATLGLLAVGATATLSRRRRK